MIAAEHPEVASQALMNHLRTGGSTFDPRTGEDMNGRNEWAVSVMPESSRVASRPFSPEEYSAFAAQHANLLSKHQNSSIGTHYDPQTALHHLEIVGLTPNKGAAQEHASALGDKEIYHLGRGEHSPVSSGNNRPEVIPFSPDERFSSLHDATPPRQSFRGNHFSPAKIDKIDGSRRGQSGIGAEAARLRAKPNAPAGFHVYADGSLPDKSLSEKIAAYPVEGKFSFASTADPVFQNAYRQSFSGDHGSAVNAAETAVRDAGYDGYYNARQPDSRFVFGSYGVKNA